MFYGLGVLLTRFWCAEEDPIVIAIGVFVALGGMALVLMVWMDVRPGGAGDDFLTRGWVAMDEGFVWLTLAQTAVAVAAMPILAQAYRIGSSSYVAVFEYSFLVYAALWTWMLWGQGTSVIAAFGIVMIVMSGVAMTVLQRRVVAL